MAIKKIVEKVITTSLETVAVDVPGRPDLLWVYSRKPRSKKHNFNRFLMERSVYNAATSPDDLVEYVPSLNGFGMHVYPLSKDHLESMITGARVPLISLEIKFGQELDDGWRLLFTQTPKTKQIIYTNPDGSPIYRNPVMHFDSGNFDLEKFYEEQKDNPDLIFIPSPKGEVIITHWKDANFIHVSFFLNDEQHKVLQELDRESDTLQAFLESNTVIGKYRIKEEAPAAKPHKKAKK